MSKQRGFTLIEMAFVIAIVGLMVGGGLFAVGPLLLQAKTTQTNGNLDQIEAALVLFAIRNNRLPCPADGSVANTSTNYGLEVTPQTNAGTAADTCNMAAFGGGTLASAVIPWRSLGLDETDSVDGWGNRISYFPANPMITGVGSLVDSSSTANCLSRITLYSFVPPTGTRSQVCDPANSLAAGTTYTPYKVPTYPFNNYIAVYAASNPFGVELTVANPAGNANDTVGSANYVSNYGQRAAYVLVSHGPSGFYGWTKVGTQLLPPAGDAATVKAYNSGVIANMAGVAGSLGFVQGTIQNFNNRNSAGYFDDIVRWRSPAYIIQNCGGASCGNP